MIFVGHVATSFRDADAYASMAGAVASDPKLALREVSRQVWANAGVAHQKHRWVARAVACFGSGLALALLTGLALLLL